MYPLPTTLAGATVNGRPNYITIAHVRIMDLGSVSLGMSKAHYANIDTKENETFSNNIPSVGMVEKTEYCGLFSGKTIGKASIFKTFYGKLKTGPIIEECPIKMECILTKTIDFPHHDIFISEVSHTYCDDTALKVRVSITVRFSPSSLS